MEIEKSIPRFPQWIKNFIALVLLLITAGIGGQYLSMQGIGRHGGETLAASVSPTQSPLSCPSPTPEVPFRTYTVPKIEPKAQYNVFLVGDSMTHALGPHGGTLNTFINDLYKPNKRYINIDNYSQPSTNILSIKDQMNTKTTYWDSTFDPLLSRDVDMILIESFGYNPLSQYASRSAGLAAQNQALDDIVKTIMTTHPHTAIVFVATIAPNKTNYAKTFNPNLSVADRTIQAQERMDYIKNHIAYARSHNIPLIDIYDASLTEQGDGNLTYINPSDYIHPSFAGVDFIGHQIANFIYDSQILPR